MRSPLTSAAAALLLCVPILAQPRLVVPAAMDGVEGVGGSSVPFGLTQPLRAMFVYNGEELPFAGPTMMKGLWARADHSTTPPADTIPVKQYLTLSVLVSTSTARAEAADARFDRNHGLDMQLVIAGANVSLPAQPTTLGVSGVPAPRPFNVPLLFPKATFFDITPIRTPYGLVQKSLVVELLIVSQPSGAYPTDSPLACSSKIRWFGRQGPRCVTSPHGQPLELSCEDSLKAGGNFTLTVSEVPPGNPFAIVLGGSEVGTWRGQPLPVDLTPLGGYDCFVNVDWLHTAFGLADAQGVGRASFGIPSARYVVGLDLFAQAVCQDISANPLLHATSLGIRSTVCGPLGVARISYLGNYTNTTGTVTYGAALIFEVR